MAVEVRIYPLAEPLAGARSARYDIWPGSGNLSIDGLAESQMLAEGTLEYVDSLGPPTRALDMQNGLAALTLRGAQPKQAKIRLPWAACGVATGWQIHLNPDVPAEIKAYSDGGNIRMDLGVLALRRLAAETGGGAIFLRLPEQAEGLFVAAQSGAGSVEVEIGGGLKGSSNLTLSSGAGNVTVLIPKGLAASIHASTGMGKTLIDPAFSKINGVTYQSPGYESARERVEITLKSGMGSVIARLK